MSGGLGIGMGSGGATSTGTGTGTGTGNRRAVVGGGGWVRWCLVIFAVISALCVSGPALYWKFNNNHNKIGAFNPNHLSLSSQSSCPPCTCHCPPPPSLLQIAPGLANLSISDCGSTDPDLKKEMEKQFVDLLTEELKLQEGVAAEHAQHMNVTLTEARRVGALYQREADKCIAATETCEGSRERSEAWLRKERKLTSLWEQRARNLGWDGE